MATMYTTYDKTDKIGATPASTLVQSTGDMMNNIFDVLITFPWNTEAGPEGSYRCKGFTPPEPKTPTYKVTWHGIEVTRIGAGVKMDRKIDLNFRLDGNYSFYRKLTMWLSYSHDVNTGGVANQRVGGENGLSNDGKIVVIAPGQEYNPSMFNDAYYKPGNTEGDNQLLNAGGFTGSLIAWQYNQVCLFELGQPKFENVAEGKSQEVKASFIFGDALYPGFTNPNAKTA